MKHRYGKSFDHEIEAQETLKGFQRAPRIDGRDVLETEVVPRNEKFWVEIILDGDVDPDVLFQATGYIRLD